MRVPGSPASLLSTVLAVMMAAAPMRVGAATDKKQAETLLHEGSRLYANGDYERALNRFTAAYDIFKSPSILFNVAKAEQQLLRGPQAAQHFRQFLQEVVPTDANAGFRGEATSALAALEKSVARIQVRTDPTGAKVSVDNAYVTDNLVYLSAGMHLVLATFGGKTAQTQITVTGGEIQEVFLALGSTVLATESRLDIRSEPTGAAVELDGKRAGVAPLVVDVATGEHRVVVRLPGYADLTRQLTTLGGATTQLQLTLSPASPVALATTSSPVASAPTAPQQPAGALTSGAPGTESPPASSSPALFWTGVGLGVGTVGSFGTAVGFGVSAENTSHDLVNHYHSGPTATWLESTARSRQTTANVLYGVAGVAAVASATALILSGTF